MKSNGILILFCFFLLIFSCTKEPYKPLNNIDSYTKLNFNYEEITSDLTEPVYGVQFIDKNTGYAVGYGKVFKTINGGINWSVDSLCDVPLFSLYFIDNNIGYVVGGESFCPGYNCTPPGSVVFKTTDAGVTWTQQLFTHNATELNSVCFIDENIGFAVGPGIRIKTTDGGDNWQNFNVNNTDILLGIKFIDSQTGFIYGLFGQIFKTSNQGATFMQMENDCSGHVYDLCMVNNTVGYAGGQQYPVKTVDSGSVWQVIAISPSEIYFIWFADEYNGIAIGKGHYTGGCFGYTTNAVYRTNDAGKTWVTEDPIEFDWRASFYSKCEGYAVVPGKTFKLWFE